MPQLQAWRPALLTPPDLFLSGLASIIHDANSKPSAGTQAAGAGVAQLPSICGQLENDSADGDASTGPVHLCLLPCVEALLPWSFSGSTLSVMVLFDWHLFPSSGYSPFESR